MTEGIATGRADHARAQRNMAFAAYDRNLKALTRYQIGGVIGPSMHARLAAMATDVLVATLDELDAFEAQEQPSRLVQRRLYVAGGLEP